jgi:MscS family membrane protein
MNVGNLSRRDRRRFNAKVGLRQETSPDQIGSLLDKMRALLRQHPKVDPLASPTRTVYKLPESAEQQKVPDPNTVTMRRRG